MPPGVLPDASPESVLEDLVSADRYRLLGMKGVSQSMVRLSPGSCLQVGRNAELLFGRTRIKALPLRLVGARTMNQRKFGDNVN